MQKHNLKKVQTLTLLQKLSLGAPVIKKLFPLFSLILVSLSSLCVNVSAEPVEAVLGKIKLNSLLQFWYQNDIGAIPKDTFRVRRAEVRLSGELKPDVVSWAIMVDPAQIIEHLHRKSPLQDFVVTLKPYKCCSIDFGQYKVPFGMEGLEPSAKLDFVERSALATYFNWTDYRDIGFTVKAEIKVGDVKIQPVAGIFNGEGQNKLDINEPMGFVGRLVVKPMESLHLAIAHYNIKTGSGAAETDKIPTGIEIKFAKDPITVYGEYATGKSGGKNKQTYYISAGYKFLNSWQAVVRYDFGMTLILTNQTMKNMKIQLV